eukprot:COSAG01_NODE_35362_length_533_cov_0.714286_1_plen_119_part_00
MAGTAYHRGGRLALLVRAHERLVTASNGRRVEDHLLVQPEEGHQQPQQRRLQADEMSVAMSVGMSVEMSVGMSVAMSVAMSVEMSLACEASRGTGAISSTSPPRSTVAAHAAAQPPTY